MEPDSGGTIQIQSAGHPFLSKRNKGKEKKIREKIEQI